MKVKNGLFGKIIRTIGFVAIFVGSVILLITNIEQWNWSLLVDSIKPVKEFVESNLEFLVNYQYVIFIGGLILLFWTQSRSIFFRIMLTLIGLVTVVGLNVSAEGILVPFINNATITKFFEDAFNDLPWLSAALALTSIFVTFLLLSVKRPKRISTSTVNSGVFFLLVAVVLYYLPSFLTIEFFEETIYQTIIIAVFTFSYSLTLLGSAFGMIGFFRK